MSSVGKCLLIAAFLAGSSAFAGPALKSSPALIEKGKTSYAVNCASCHGDKLDGMGVAGQYMNPKPRNLITEKYKAGDQPAQVFKTVTSGLKGTTMVGFAHVPEEERWGIVHYILSERKPAKK